MCVCVCVCVRACVRACVRVRVCVCVCGLPRQNQAKVRKYQKWSWLYHWTE